MNEEIVKRQLTIRSFHCHEVVFGAATSFVKDGDYYKMTIKKDIAEDLKKSSDLFEDLTVKILKPGEHHVKINSVMDVFPISVKALGNLGEGITHTITGAYVMLTGVDTNGRQICAFGNSDGWMDEKVTFNQPGTPSDEDYIILVDVLIKEGYATKRIGPDACHAACEIMCEPLRANLKKFREGSENEKHVYRDLIHPGKKKVCVVKLVSGQGAMYDTHYFAKDPSGFTDSRSIIDSVGSPIILSPNEYRDGALRCLYG
ncbi:MAG: proline reductase cluster protein PrdD [Lachnospiraceae bacterium]|nr:proline reductase cluster protein PrdD [Lachnospiraceae bacterium]MBR1844794.1 proline reductase cluster protein PrdD [Lachnospiraceae bacterium]